MSAIGLLEKLPHTATVQAEADSTIYRISGGALLDAVSQGLVISGELLGSMMIASIRPTGWLRRP